MHQQRGEGAAVVGPQRQEFVRKREHDVVVRARQQPRDLLIGPTRLRHGATARAAAVPAGVELELFDCAFGAAEHVRAERARAAHADRVRGTALAITHRRLCRDLREVALHELLLRHSHRGLPGVSGGRAPRYWP